MREARRENGLEVPGHQGTRPTTPSGLAAAALTILRAHVVAGRPKADPLRVMGKFEAWQDVVQQAVYWTIGIDPCASRSSIEPESRGNKAALGAVLQAWSRLPKGMVKETGVEAKAALKLAATDANHQDLKEALTPWSKDGATLPDARTLGYKLRSCRGKVAEGPTIGGARTTWKLCNGGTVGHDKVAGWWVEQLSVRSVAGDEGHAGDPPGSSHTRTRTDAHTHTGKLPDQSPACPPSPATGALFEEEL